MWHRARGVSSHPRGPHRTPHTYSQIIVLHKGDRIPEKLSHTAGNHIGRKNDPEEVFFVSPFGGKNPLEYDNMEYGGNLGFSSVLKSRA